jgi:signal peptidase II
MRFKRNLLFWVAAVISLVLDHLTKFWVVQNFDLTEPPQTQALLPGVFHFTYVVNTGAAFSLFSNGGAIWLRWLSLAVSVGLIVLAWFGPRINRWEQAGYGLILGGALGNGIDRFVSGHVVDFIHLRFIRFPVFNLVVSGHGIDLINFRIIEFPIFNLADVCISAGIICLLIATFYSPPPPRSQDDRDSISE